MNYNVDENGYYGRFGGAYIPEILHSNVETLRREYLRIIDDPAFQKEFHDLLTDYVGRPSPLTFAPRMSERYGTKSTSNAKTSTTPGPTRSTTPSARSCWPGAWVNPASSPKPEPGSTEWRRLRSAP